MGAGPIVETICFMMVFVTLLIVGTAVLAVVARSVLEGVLAILAPIRQKHGGKIPEKPERPAPAWTPQAAEPDKRGKRK